jgi:hypothetical protein
MQFVLLKLLNSLVETTHTLEHVVVLLFVPIYILSSLTHLNLHFFNHRIEFFNLGSCLIQMLLHISSSCDSLNGKSLFSIKFIFQIISLLHQLIMHFHRHLPLVNSLILFFLLNFPEFNLSPEHGRQELSILSNFLKLIRDFLLKLLGLFDSWQVHVLQSLLFLGLLFKIMLYLLTMLLLQFDLVLLVLHLLLRVLQQSIQSVNLYLLVNLTA